MQKKRLFWGLTALIAVTVIGAQVALGYRQGKDAKATSEVLPTGKSLYPQGTPTNVGSFPVNMALSPDGKYIAVTNTGYRQFLSILNAENGKLVSQLPFNGEEDRNALYYGLTFQPGLDPGSPGKSYLLYASRGPEDKVSAFTIDAQGQISPASDTSTPSMAPAQAPRSARTNFVAGIAASGGYLYVTNNESSAYTDFKGSMTILAPDPAANSIGKMRVVGTVPTPGFPYAVTAMPADTATGKPSRVYVASEQDGCVSVFDMADPKQGRHIKDIPTGDHPMALLLDGSHKRLFVANASSDTVSQIDTATNMVTRTWQLRGKSALPGVTPSSLALNPDESRLYVTLADENALAIIDLKSQKNAPIGRIPVGWYPTSVIVSRDGKRLFVASAKGVRSRNPNGANGKVGNRTQYIENIIEGTVSLIPTPADADLPQLTALAERTSLAPENRNLPKTPIKHVIYIIKENRTYDEVLGDMPQGNGAKDLVLFGRDVTPNQHALAERFVLLDNFYCAAEVSADGWNWSVEGMASEYNQRNVPFNYSGRGRDYDYEGAINGTPVDLIDRPDVNRAPGGYIWDKVASKNLTYRNYGFYNQFADTTLPNGKVVKANEPTRKALANGHTDVDYLRFAMDYPDSDVYRLQNVTIPKLRTKYGQHNSPSRFAEWKREFDAYVAAKNLPAFEMVRFPCDHTEGTRTGSPSPRAMVADNDYAVGQLVEAVSKSPYWKETAIFIVEDDAQDGIDHVDAHRSIAFVISPCIRQGSVDHHFYNTNSVLHSMEQLLGLSPLCRHDAAAPVIGAFQSTPANSAPYTAILPDRSVVSQINNRNAYRAKDSDRLDFAHADRVPDDLLNDILWHSIKGANVPLPTPRHTR